MVHVPDTPTARTTGNQKLTPRKIDAWLAQHRLGKVPAFAKLGDGDGMYLTHTKAGTPVWRVKYRLAGLEDTFAIGAYPEISLAQAREKREWVRAHVRAGRDPKQARDLERDANIASSGTTFEVVAREWLKQKKKQWSAIHHEKSMQALERNVFDKIGHLPVAEIPAAKVTAVVEAISARGANVTAGKIRQHIGGVFRLARAKGLCEYKENPAEPAREVLPRRSRQKRRPALLKWAELGELLRRAETARLSPTVRMAHRLCAFAAGVRIGNVIEAEWSEFRLDAEPALWVIPRRKMKAKDRTHDHTIILGPTIAAELRNWRGLSRGKGFVFPSTAEEGHITREALEKAYRQTLGMADRHSPHGWRSALSTLAREEGGFERDVVELALDHIHDNEVVRAYDRGERMEKRIRLMTWWDEQLARAQRGADVVPLAAKAAA